MDRRSTSVPRLAVRLLLCHTFAISAAVMASPNSATADSADAETHTEAESEASGDGPTTTDEGDEEADTEDSAFSRRAPGDMTLLAGLPWGQARSTSAGRAHVSGLFTGLNYHLGRNGALTARLEWIQQVNLGDIDERNRMDTSAMLQMAFGIRMQFPVGASMFGLGLSLTGTSYLDRVPLPVPGVALSASYAYRFSQNMSLGLSARQAAPFPFHQRVGLFVGYDF